MPRRDTNLDKLKSVLKYGDLDNAGFIDLAEELPITLNSHDEVDAFIKKRIRLWLASWIINPVVDVVIDLETRKRIAKQSRERLHGNR